MKKKILSILILITLVGIFSPVFYAGAAESCSIAGISNKTDCELVGGTWGTVASTNYTLLAPLPGTTSFDTSPNSNALGEYINLIIRLVIGISAVLAVVMIVIGGIEYMGNELISNKEEGRERIYNAIFGLLIALGAYALLNTINPDLLNSDVKIDKATVVVNINDSVPQTYDPITKKYKNGATYGAPWTGTPTPLRPGITLNNGGLQCSSIGQTGCTSTIGLNISAAFAVQDGCKCSIVITGGTEWWLHGAQSGSTSHQQGNSTVDLGRNSALDAYLSGGKPLVLYTRYGPGGLYYFEGDHWHIGP